MQDTILHRWLQLPYLLNVRRIINPRRSHATVLFIHGIGNTGAAWDDVIKKLPKDIRIVTIDLLGFGDSPRPSHDVYNAKTQARSVLVTYLKLLITGRVIVVGHSLGALVAIEVAKRYPFIVSSLILVSPPLYDTSNIPSRFRLKKDDLLVSLYRVAEQRPDNFVKLSALAMKYNLINKTYNVTDDNVAIYMATLESMIINQNSYDNVQKLRMPTRILRGTLDPFIVNRNLKMLTAHNPNIVMKSIVAGHEVRGPFIGAVVKEINDQLSRRT